MKAFLAALAGLLRDPRTFFLVISLSVLARRYGATPLMVLGGLALFGVSVSAWQAVGLVGGFVALLGLIHLANLAPSAHSVPAPRPGVAR
ncbi:hypothetical protein KV557_24765 [Kitasatospora aureofaciens]|uniref:hypothetical protein n=1 Tax=Kitasatospora aureofaciens TaxID=1894 RepID=UPI001C4814A5|nr:hypothetical protein [Kitasatospora aureofaciens]MBV6700278.1 hypothetical protein [Kitasatospora aureofaciens]